MSMGHLQASTESLVVTAHTEEEGYGSSASSSAPELPTGVCETTASRLMRELFRLWQLDHERYGTPQWNPLADLIPKGAFVLLKPNWVMHRNRSGAGLDCLVTNTSVLEAVLEYVALTAPKQVIIGDAPIQGCDFA